MDLLGGLLAAIEGEILLLDAEVHYSAQIKRWMVWEVDPGRWIKDTTDICAAARVRSHVSHAATEGFVTHLIVSVLDEIKQRSINRQRGIWT